jgi:hypothetical protein
MFELLCEQGMQFWRRYCENQSGNLGTAKYVLAELIPQGANATSSASFLEGPAFLST